MRSGFRIFLTANLVGDHREKMLILKTHDLQGESFSVVTVWKSNDIFKFVAPDIRNCVFNTNHNRKRYFDPGGFNFLRKNESHVGGPTHNFCVYEQ